MSLMADITDDFRAIFLSEIDAFMKRSGLAATAIGVKVMRDPNFVHRLRKGKSCSIDNADAVRRWMREYQSEAAE